MKKLFFLFLILLLLIPLVLGATSKDDEEPKPKCSWFNIMDCITESFQNTIASIVMAPITPLTNFVEILLTTPVRTDYLEGIWNVIINILSLTYGLIIVGIGFYIIANADNPKERSNAKEMMKNIIIMMILVNISFYLYDIMIMLGGALTKIIFYYVPDGFFTISSFGDVALQIVFGICYIGVLIVTILLLLIRYILLSIGVVLFPLGIYFRYIPLFDSFGKFILNILIYNIAFSFIFGIIILAVSKMTEIQPFSNFKMFCIMGALTTIDLFIIIITIMTILKSVMSSDAVKTGITVGKFLL